MPVHAMRAKRAHSPLLERALCAAKRAHSRLLERALCAAKRAHSPLLERALCAAKRAHSPLLERALCAAKNDKPLWRMPDVVERITSHERQIAIRSRQQHLHIARLHDRCRRDNESHFALAGVQHNLIPRFNETQRTEEFIAMRRNADVPRLARQRSMRDMTRAALEDRLIVALVNGNGKLEPRDRNFADALAWFISRNLWLWLDGDRGLRRCRNRRSGRSRNRPV